MGRVPILLRRLDLAFLYLEHRARDRHLLAVIGVIDTGDQCTRLDPSALVEGQLHNPGLHRLERENALVRLNIA